MNISSLNEYKLFFAEHKILVLIICVLLYVIYYRKYRKYIFVQKKIIGNSERPRGQCPPFFPNGWYRLCRNHEIKVEEAKHFDIAGRNIVLFRGTSKKLYALDAYCAHMGVNLGIASKVKNGRCIECPFHGWLYDGETGKSVLDEKFTPRKGEFFEYNNGVDNPKKDKENKFLKKCGEGEISIKKYELREVNGIIMIWYHSDEKLRSKPQYEPFEYKPDLDHRGESAQYVNCHIQEIPENGADIRHFDFVHLEPAPYMGTKLARFTWAMKTKNASDPDLYEYMKHENKKANDYKMERLRNYIKEEERKYINVLSLDCSLVLFGKWKFFFFNATGIQFGPSNVILFLYSPFFNATFIQNLVPISKFQQKVYHNIYTNSFIPYGLSALMLRLEVNQVYNDTIIWNKKIFGSKLVYNLKTQADIFLKNWREWYAQFYEGCKENEEKIEKLDW